VRYWSSRARRESFYVGKVLGTWGVVASLTLLIHVLTWLIVIQRGETVGAVLEWGPRLWLVALPISLAWCAIAQLVGSQFRYPMLSLLATLGAFFVVWVAFLVSVNVVDSPLQYLNYLYPSSFDDWLLHPHLDRVAEALGICFGSAAIYIAAGAALFRVRDV
jgi:hypothetical protein